LGRKGSAEMRACLIRLPTGSDVWGAHGQAAAPQAVGGAPQAVVGIRRWGVAPEAVNWRA
jgi:hypothetical protein